MASLEILPDQVRARFAHFVDSGQDFALVVSELDLLSGKKQRTLLAQYCELINVAKLQRHKFWQELQEHGHIHSSTRTNANSLSLVGIQNRHQFVAWLMRYHNRTFPITPAYLHRLSVFYTGKNKLHKGITKEAMPQSRTIDPALGSTLLCGIIFYSPLYYKEFTRLWNECQPMDATGVIGLCKILLVQQLYKGDFTHRIPKEMIADLVAEMVHVSLPPP
jgi:hypothetical protein